MYRVNPIPNLNSTDKSHDLIGSQVERVQAKAKIRMLDKREKTEGTVLHPLQNNTLGPLNDFSFHKSRELAYWTHSVSGLLKLLPVCHPRNTHGLVCVMKEINIT